MRGAYSFHCNHRNNNFYSQSNSFFLNYSYSFQCNNLYSFHCQLSKFLIELGVFPNASSPLDLYCDNSGATAQAKDSKNHQKSKHVMRRFHLIREFVKWGEIKIWKTLTDLNVSYPLTKLLPQPKNEAHTRAMGIWYIIDWL